MSALRRLWLRLVRPGCFGHYAETLGRLCAECPYWGECWEEYERKG